MIQGRTRTAHSHPRIISSAYKKDRRKQRPAFSRSVRRLMLGMIRAVGLPRARVWAAVRGKQKALEQFVEAPKIARLLQHQERTTAA